MGKLDYKISETMERYFASGIEQQVDYEKFYLYSLITHSTAIEGSTVTEVENQLLFDEGIIATGRTTNEQMMNIDLRNAYMFGFEWIKKSEPYSTNLLCELSAMVMRHTGSKYSVLGGEFDSSKGEFRLCNVSAGVGGKSYMAFAKVPLAVDDFCRWLNSRLVDIDRTDVAACYRLSFEAHFRLVTIHPWVDGNGRATRLLMNMVQRQLGLVPSIVTKDNKSRYIQALVDSRETGDSSIIQDVMLGLHIENIENRILQYQNSIGDTVNNTVNDTVNEDGRQGKLVGIIKEHPEYTYEQYANALGVGRATVARIIKRLVASGIIKHIGSDKTGHWVVVK